MVDLYAELVPYSHGQGYFDFHSTLACDLLDSDGERFLASAPLARLSPDFGHSSHSKNY